MTSPRGGEELAVGQRGEAGSGEVVGVHQQVLERSWGGH